MDLLIKQRKANSLKKEFLNKLRCSAISTLIFKRKWNVPMSLLDFEEIEHVDYNSHCELSIRDDIPIFDIELDCLHFFDSFQAGRLPKMELSTIINMTLDIPHIALPFILVTDKLQFLKEYTYDIPNIALPFSLTTDTIQFISHTVKIDVTQIAVPITLSMDAIQLTRNVIHIQNLALPLVTLNSTQLIKAIITVDETLDLNISSMPFALPTSLLQLLHM